MLKTIVHRLGTFVGNPWVQLVVALVLIVSSIMQSWDSLAEDILQLKFRAHHGTLLLGFSHLFRTLPDLVEGVERVTETIE